MKANANVIQFGALDEVILRVHPPVIRSRKAKTGNGEMEAGTLIAYDAGGEIVPYKPGVAPEGAAIGVLVRNCDTDDVEDIARYIVHGTVRYSKLQVDGHAPTESDILLLEELGVWSMRDPMN